MPDLSILATPAPYHVLTYGTLLGTQFFQSFVGGVVAYKALPRPQFSSLQQAIFPIYFSLQTALPIVLALTVPGESTPLGKTNSGLGGFLAEKNRLNVLVPILTIFMTSLANLLFIGPATTRIMRERKHQGNLNMTQLFTVQELRYIGANEGITETKDGKKSYDSPPHSKEMARMNKQFGRMHGVSALVNMGGLLATVWYGITIAERLQ